MYEQSPRHEVHAVPAPPLRAFDRMAPESASRATPVQGEITVPSIPHEHQPAAVRQVETAIGTIAVIHEDTSRVPYSATDLGDMLAAHDLAILKRPTYCAPNKSLVIPPDNSDVIVRWNLGRVYEMPDEPSKLIEHVQTFQDEIDRLQRLGITMLERNVYIVENDPHLGLPTVYMAVQRHPHEKPMTVEHGDHDIQLDICSKIADYLIGTPPGAHYIHDNLTWALQYAEDGTLFDYDIDLKQSNDTRAEDLRRLEGWTKRLTRAPSTERLAVLTKIDNVPWKNNGLPTTQQTRGG